VARQRQRARDRKGRGDAHPTETHRDNVPGALDHASGDVDEFEAGIVAGGEGVAADAFGTDDDADPSDAFGAGGGGGAGVAAEDPDDDYGLPDRPAVGAPTTGRGNRVFNFLRASWAELQRVQWPDRRQVAQATGVVAGFVIIAGLYLGLADTVAQKIVDYILNNTL
jgi:preprotein translocase subunit SecE